MSVGSFVSGDLVQRLRDEAKWPNPYHKAALLCEAADEIERLTALLKGEERKVQL
jgi:hypothetical protein